MKTKRFLSVVMALIFVLSLTTTAFASESGSNITTYNKTITISNVIKTGHLLTDKTFDRAKVDAALEVSQDNKPVTEDVELYYCSAAPVTIAFNKAEGEGAAYDGITKYNYYYLDIPSEPKVEITRYPTVYYHPVADEDIEEEAFTGKITLQKPGTYYLYAANARFISTNYDIGIYIVVGDGTAPATPTTPTTPAPTTPILPKTVTATPTPSKVLVNGKAVEFDAFTINGYNYFKLRDLAQAVNGTNKNFEVTWDGSKNAINLLSNSKYTVAGGELTKGDGQPKTGNICTSTIYKDGEVISLSAYTIGGYNYFKLRDIAQAFDIGVTYDGSTSTIGIDTATGYIVP